MRLGCPLGSRERCAHRCGGGPGDGDTCCRPRSSSPPRLGIISLTRRCQLSTVRARSRATRGCALMRSPSRSALLFGASICATLVLLAGPFGGIGFAHGTDPVTSGGVQYAYYNGYGACARANLYHQGAGQSPGNGYVAANTFTAVRAGACYPGTAVGALMDNWTTIIKTGGALCGGPSWSGPGAEAPLPPCWSEAPTTGGAPDRTITKVKQLTALGLRATTPTSTGVPRAS